MHRLRLRNTLNVLIHTAGEGVNSTIIQCVNEQSLTGIQYRYHSLTIWNVQEPYR